MSYAESNPERKNLTLLSLCIILFYLAEGAFIDSTVRLQVINVSFSKPEALVYAVWGLLAWFTYRYWLVHKGSWKQEFNSEIQTTSFPKILIEATAKRLVKRNCDPDTTSNITITSATLLPRRTVYRMRCGYRTDNSQLKQDFQIDGFIDNLLIMLHLTYLFLCRKSLSTHFTPYFFALIATALGLYNGPIQICRTWLPAIISMPP